MLDNTHLFMLTYTQVIDAKTPEAALMVEGEDARVDNRIIKDERSKIDPERTISARNNELSDRIG